MKSTDSPFVKSDLKFFNFRPSKLIKIINRFRLILSNRSRDKELKQFQTALNNINATFLNSYQFKYGYVRPPILSDINLEVLTRLMDKKNPELEELKQKVTAKGVTYLVLYQTCISFSNSFYHSSSCEQNPHLEPLLDLIRFSLDGLAFEKIKN